MIFFSVFAALKKRKQLATYNIHNSSIENAYNGADLQGINTQYMKKTLITLAALASASVANAEYTFDEMQGKNWDDGNIAAFNDFAFTFTIHSADDVSTDGTILATLTLGSNASDGCTHLGYVLTRGADDSITLTVGRGRTDGTTFSFWPSTESETNSVTFTALETGIDYTAKNNVSASTMYASLWEDGVKTATHTYSGILYDGDSISTYLNDSFDPAATTSGGGNIPEPATATLSLLALTGLAARRRRK